MINLQPTIEKSASAHLSRAEVIASSKKLIKRNLVNLLIVYPASVIAVGVSGSVIQSSATCRQSLDCFLPHTIEVVDHSAKPITDPIATFVRVPSWARVPYAFIIVYLYHHIFTTILHVLYASQDLVITLRMKGGLHSDAE